MRLHLGGHLNWYDPHKRAWHEIALTAPTNLRELIEQMGVPSAEVETVALNGTLVELDHLQVQDGDCVELFPAIGGG
jgi:sulfur carrier protein ThiS